MIIIFILGWALCLCPCSHEHARLLKPKYDMSRPDMFFAKPLRDHWANKHRMDVSDVEVGKKSKAKVTEKNTVKEQEAVLNCLAIFSADTNLQVSACEKKTLYNVAQKLHELFLKAGPSTKFCELFPGERICGRKLLGNRLKSMASNLQDILW